MYHVTELKIPDDSTNICHPVPGQTFSYEERKETEPKSSHALFHIPKTLIVNTSWKCTAGQPASAFDLYSSLTGDYLPVTCKGIDLNTNKIILMKYGFLIDSEFYFKLEGSADEPLGNSRWSYSFIDFLPN